MSDKKLFSAKEAALAVLAKTKEILEDSSLMKAEKLKKQGNTLGAAIGFPGAAQTAPTPAPSSTPMPKSEMKKYETENNPKAGIKYGKIEKDVKPVERDYNEYEVKSGNSKDSTGPRLKEQTSPSQNPKEEAEGNNKPDGMEPEFEFKDKVSKELAKEKASHMVKSQSGMHTVIYQTAAIEKSENEENDLIKSESLEKARVDEGLSDQRKASQRAKRNDRSYSLSEQKAPKSTLARESKFRSKEGALAGKSGEKVYGKPAGSHKETGVHTGSPERRDLQGRSAAGINAEWSKKHSSPGFAEHARQKAVEGHTKKLNELKDMPKPNLPKSEDMGKAEESKHDRCVKDVERNSPDVKNPHAVCVAEGVKPAKWGKAEGAANPDEKEDAELGEQVEKDVEQHFKENAEAEKEEGHDLMAKPEDKSEGQTEHASTSAIPRLVLSAKLSKFMEHMHSKRKNAQAQSAEAVGHDATNAPAPGSSQAGQPDSSRPKTQPTTGDMDKAESNFDKLKHKIEDKEGYSEKGAAGAAYEAGKAKYGKAGMAAKAAAGRKK